MRPETRRNIFKHVVIFCGEFIGTSFLLIYGCTGVNDKQLSQTHAATVWAFLVAAIVTAFGHLTMCHINPCVTTCVVILGIVGPFTALVYYVAQILGAIFGFYVALVLTKNSLLANVTNPDSGFCMTQLAPHVSAPQGFLCEFLATSLLIFAVCAVTDRRNTEWGDSIAIKIGLVIGILVYGAGPLTGASMNPARSFAPALLYKKWKNHWIYWAAPFAGSICTTLLYRLLFLTSVEEEIVPVKILKPLGSDGLKPSALVVEAHNPISSMTEIKPSEVSSQL